MKKALRIDISMRFAKWIIKRLAKMIKGTIKIAAGLVVSATILLLMFCEKLENIDQFAHQQRDVRSKISTTDNKEYQIIPFSGEVVTVEKNRKSILSENGVQIPFNEIEFERWKLRLRQISAKKASMENLQWNKNHEYLKKELSNNELLDKNAVDMVLVRSESMLVSRKNYLDLLRVLESDLNVVIKRGTISPMERSRIEERMQERGDAEKYFWRADKEMEQLSFSV